MNLNGKLFKAQSNSDNGEVGAGTIFHYRQKENIVWATYEGGDVLFGTLSGKREGNQLYFTYQHQNLSGEFMTGKCTSEMRLEGNKIRLYESWEWTCRDFSKGESILIEVER